LLSTFAFEFNLRRHTLVEAGIKSFLSGVEAGGLMKTSNRLTLNILLLLRIFRAYVRAFILSLKVRTALMSVEWLFSTTLLRGPHHPAAAAPRARQPQEGMAVHVNPRFTPG